VFQAYRTGRKAIGIAVAAVVVATLGAGGAHAEVKAARMSGVGPHCVTHVNQPKAGLTTLTDSTLPKLSSVSWAHSSVAAKPKSTVRITVKLSDNCSGASDVVLELHNTTTHQIGYFGATYKSSSITSSAIHDTWIVDVPLYGTDAGSIMVSSVSVLTGFTSLVYETSNPTRSGITDVQPHDDQVTPEDYHKLMPPHATKIAVKAATTLTAGAPMSAHRGHPINVSATLHKLKTSAYIAAPSLQIHFQYKAPGSNSWRSLKTAKTGHSGIAKATYVPSKAGTYRFRAVYAGSTYVASATSSAHAVKVS
jgi:hypothetical protein